MLLGLARIADRGFQLAEQTFKARVDVLERRYAETQAILAKVVDIVTTIHATKAEVEKMVRAT